MERLSRVLGAGLAVALMASVTLSVGVQGAGVDYWLNVVKGSKPQMYQDLNDAVNGPSGSSDCNTWYGNGYFEHVTSMLLGGLLACWGGNEQQHSQGNPSAGATSVMLSTSTDNYSVATVHDNQVMTMSPGTNGPMAVMVWTKIDACSLSTQHSGYATIAILQGAENYSQTPSVYTSDCGDTVVLRDMESGSWVNHSFGGPKTGRWFMTAWVWAAGVLTYYTGYQGEGVVEHTQTGADQPQAGNGHPGLKFGTTQLVRYPDQGVWSAEWWGMAAWKDADAIALLSPPAGNTGDAATWLGILNSFTPFAVQTGTGCIATTSGPQDCTSNKTQAPAPLSGSIKKFQIGYLPIVDCGAFPTVAVSAFFGISLTIPDPVGFVPWALCNAQDVVFMGVNALIFAANVAIDLVMPDGSGIAVWQKSQAEALTRFPYGYVISAWNQLGSAMGVPGMGSYGCSGTAGSVSSCGYSGGWGSFTFSLRPGQQAGTVVDMPALLALAGLHAWQGWMTCVVYGGFGIMLLRAARGDLAGKPE